VPKSGCLAINKTMVVMAAIEINIGKSFGGNVFSLRIEAMDYSA
jgi:hypothetical protein